MSTTCIILSYNEYPRIKYAIKRLSTLACLDEIILVDDSADNKTETFVRNYPHIKYIHNKTRQGKTFATKQGLTLATNPNILLFDGDLTYFDTEPIKYATNYFKNHKNIDTIIFRADYVKIKFTRADLLQSGVRLIRKHYLKQVLDQKISGYQIEVAICYYTLDHNLKSAWVNFPSSQHNKIIKYRSILGLIADLIMNLEIFRLRGFINYLKLARSYQPPQLLIEN